MSHASEPSPPEVPAGFPWPIVLGVDPGTIVVGYGALVLRDDGPRMLAAGVIRTPRTSAVPARLGHLRSELDGLLARLKPTIVVVEQAFKAANVQSALRIGEGRGVVLGAAAAFGSEVVQFAPAVMKKALVGNGRAHKKQVAMRVAEELSLVEPPSPFDATDALGLALTYVFKRPVADRS